MFGHHDDQSQQDAGTIANEPAIQAVDPGDNMSGHLAAQSPGDGSADTPAPAATDPAPKPATTPESATDQTWQHPGVPLAGDHDKIKDIISPAGGYPKRPSFQHSSSSDPDNNTPDPADSELIEVRQKALTDLAPIIDKLDLPPEEKFRTIMMVIQTSDDESMVKAAYAAAHSIEDEKARAQALLDIVNEVNYFTQPPEN